MWDCENWLGGGGNGRARSLNRPCHRWVEIEVRIHRRILDQSQSFHAKRGTNTRTESDAGISTLNSNPDNPLSLLSGRKACYRRVEVEVRINSRI